MHRNDVFKFRHVNFQTFCLNSIKLTSHPLRYNWISRYCLTNYWQLMWHTPTKSSDYLLHSWCTTRTIPDSEYNIPCIMPVINALNMVQRNKSALFYLRRICTNQLMWLLACIRLWDWSWSLWIYLKVQSRFVTFVSKQARILQNKLIRIAM